MPTTTRPLEIELVPQSSWYNNLRKFLSSKDWTVLSRFVRSDGTCDICGRHLPMSKLDAHEKWSYNDETGVQKLDDILSLCKDCHRVKHIGRAQAVGEEALAKAWFMEVNKCSESDYDEAMEEAFIKWQERSQHEWTLDVSLIDGWHGLKVCC
jgi:hypothetical protein